MVRNHPDSSPRLSVIVPLLNERENLPPLLSSLEAQTGVDLELILCDGGSEDGTLAEAQRLVPLAPWPTSISCCAAGRGRQLNAGRRLARAPYLLFLHADCRFPESDALARGVELLQHRMAEVNSHRLAARFSLHFFHIPEGDGALFHFHAAKARQNRPDCIHGDQGWLMPAAFFDQVGPFDESLPFFEDARLAPKIAAAGQWLLVDRAIVTSARRFSAEGVTVRRLLNALIMAWGRSNCDGLLAQLPGIYRQQRQTQALTLAPFVRTYRSYLAALPPALRRRHRRQLGAYLAANLWQLPLLADCQREYRRGVPPGSSPRLLQLTAPLLERLAGLTPLQRLLLAIWDLLLASQR
jgi:glycosyltransferase involved in cell wall biosynthesis